MAVDGVIPDEAALLLLIKSVVFDRHPYQLYANNGKSKAGSLGFPEGLIQEQGEILLRRWSKIVSTFAEYQSTLPFMSSAASTSPSVFSICW
jgi:hypothetical protein